MRKEPLSRVYLDDYPITLMGDESTPPLSRIIRAGGKRPDKVDVVYLTSPADEKGYPVGAEDIIDRTAEPARPIYLRTVPRIVKPETMTPVDTADRPVPLAPAVTPRFLTSRDPVPNADPVISQLGGRRTDDAPRPPHQKGVFRSPSQVAAGQDVGGRQDVEDKDKPTR